MAKPRDRKKINLKDNAYLKYSGMAFQIVAYLLVGIFIGKKLDTHFDTEQPIFTAILAMLFLAAYFFKLYIDLNRGKDS